MTSGVVLGGIVGLLLGLLWCYYKQLQTAYANRGLISSGGNLVGAAQDFYGQLTKL
jgi:hypothetical protein